MPDHTPVAATMNGDPDYDNVLSYLPGQRLSRCTCPGESHPGPVHSNNEYVGRSAPEIDMFEAQVRNVRSSRTRDVCADTVLKNGRLVCLRSRARTARCLSLPSGL